MNLDGPSKIENSNTNKLDIIQTNKINTATMNSNNQLSYQDTDTSKSIQLIEENQPKNLLETPPAEDFENAMTNFNEVIEKMKRAFESDKEYFLPSMKSFVNSFQTNVRTHASLNSAMQTFGKYSGLNPNSKKPKLMGTKQIGVQPTTRARRKTEISGRRNLAAGRNPKWKRTMEHGYVQKMTPRPQIKRKPFDPTQLPSKVLKTPHSLSYCVENNKSFLAIVQSSSCSITIILKH